MSTLPEAFSSSRSNVAVGLMQVLTSLMKLVDNPSMVVMMGRFRVEQRRDFDVDEVELLLTAEDTEEDDGTIDEVG